MPIETITVSWLLNKAWVLLIGIFWYSKKQQDTKDSDRDTAILDLQKTQIESKSNFVTEARMKAAIREALGPYKEDQQEIKVLLRGLNENVISLSRDMAVQNALRNTRHDKQNHVSE